MSQIVTLFPASVSPPRPRPDTLARPLLLERLDAALEAGVGLVCAGAGYGKTTLLASWVAGLEPEVDVAWLTLYPEHDDPAVLALHLHRALEAAGLATGPGGLEDLLVELARSAARRERRIVLALEDLHHVTSDAVFGALADLIEHRPHGLILAMSSRTEPPLLWHSYRARGDLVEVGSTRLAFNTVEIRELLEHRFGVILPSDRIEDIYRLTEGWPAAVCVLGIALRDADDAIAVLDDHPERHRFVLGYVEEQIVGKLDRERLRFLEDTSVLTRLDPELCDHLTGRGDALETLQQLVASNMFTEELVADPPVFRYHPLLRERLRARLDAERPGEAARLLVQASRWYEQRQMLFEAIDAALRCGDEERGERLITAACGPALRQGLAATVIRWLEALPGEVVSSSPELLLVVGRARGVSGDVAGAEEAFEAARAAVGEAADDPAFALAFAQIEYSRRLWKGQLTSLRDVFGGIALDRVSFDDPVLDMLAVDRESLVAWMAMAHLLSGDWSEAIDLADTNIETIPDPGGSRARIAAYGVKALALTWQGNEQGARATIGRGTPALTRFRGSSGEPVGLLVATAWIGEGSEADAALDRANTIAERLGFPLLRALTSLGAARLGLRRGDAAVARKALAKASARIAEMPDPGVLAALLERLEAEYGWLTAGTHPELTSREVEILGAVARGMSRSQVARELHYSINTVKTHLRTAYRKLGAHTAEEAVTRASALDLLPSADLAAPPGTARTSRDPSALTHSR